MGLSTGATQGFRFHVLIYAVFPIHLLFMFPMKREFCCSPLMLLTFDEWLQFVRSPCGCNLLCF